MITFQQIIQRLNQFWEKHGCCIHQGYDIECGAGTFNPVTFLRCLGPEPYKGAYVETSRRPTDGRYGKNPNRVQSHFQYQVILKPSPSDIQNVYLQSLEAMGFNLEEHDIRFVHDDWESPTLGAWGLGWETWIDGMEVTQITYFQCFGSMPVKPVTGEITYGLERLAMYLQKVDSLYDIQWNDQLTYGDIYHKNEIEWSHYNFEEASSEMWFRHFDDYEKEAKQLIKKNLPIPAYDFVAKASHAFNILDARGAISVTERTGYISRIRELSRLIAEEYISGREKLNFPLLKKRKREIPIIPPIQDLPPSVDSEDYVLEIGSEELPATFVSIGMKSLEKGVEKLLDQEHIKYGSVHTLGTPRRLTLQIRDLATTKATKTTVRKGPPLNKAYEQSGNLTPTGMGFFKSLGREPPTLSAIQNKEISEIDVRNIKGVDYLFITATEPSRPTVEILSENLPKLILGIQFPKQMRWSDLEITYARPILWVLSLFGNISVPFLVGETLAEQISYGHRQLDPDPFTVTHASRYVEELREHKVMVDTQERTQSIKKQLDELEGKLGACIIKREQLIPEILHLVEWPRVTYASFDSSFLKVPKELLISEMVEHQKYFPVADDKGNLKNLFVITVNNTPTGQIREGNCKVLSARLSDGVFLYEQDLKTTLELMNEKLSHITYQKELGSLEDKVKRMRTQSQIIHQSLKIGKKEDIDKTAFLCKADLASGAVYEFPELQGVMGKYYALAQGEPESVAKGIEEHWMPLGEKAPLPTSETGIIVGIADKIDNLISCFSVGLIPTSSSDPYALRRQVLGIIKILIEGKYHLFLKDNLTKCFSTFPDKFQKSQIIDSIIEFITNRIKTVFQDYGLHKDEIEASISFGVDDIYDSYCRVKALNEFRKESAKFPLLCEVYKRAKGQINTSEKLLLNPVLLKERAEIALNHQLQESQKTFSQMLSNHEYDQAYQQISEIQPLLAALFDEVKILDKNPQIKNNRIALLQQVFDRFSLLIDFSKITF